MKPARTKFGRAFAQMTVTCPASIKAYGAPEQLFNDRVCLCSACFKRAHAWGLPWPAHGHGMKFQDASWGRDGGSISRSRANDRKRSRESPGYLLRLTAPASERSSHPPWCQTSRPNFASPNSAHGHKGPEYVTTYFLGGC